MMIKKNGKHTIRWAAARYEAIVLSRTPDAKRGEPEPAPLQTLKVVGLVSAKLSDRVL